MEKLNGVRVRDWVMSYWNQKLNVPLKTALAMVIEMVTTLQILAELKVIHGDPHWINFLWDRDNNRMKLLDFERGRIYNQDEMKRYSPRCTITTETTADPHSVLGSSTPGYLHPWATPWDLMSCPASFSSDPYKVFIVLTRLLYGRDYDFAMTRLGYAAAEYAQPNAKASFTVKRFVEHKVKHAANMFELDEATARFLDLPPGIFTIKEVLKNRAYTDENLQAIQNLFKQLSGVLFDPHIPIHDIPDYQKVIALLEDIETETTSLE